VARSEAVTGRVAARDEVCAALVRAGLAVRHGRAGHRAVYLTPEGLRLRSELLEAAGRERGGSGTGPQPEPAARSGPSGGGFVADDGSGAVVPGPGRRRDVTAAWAGVVEIRRVLGDGRTELPAAWEAERPVHALALALEADGVPPAREGASGYRVADSGRPGLTEVTWSGPADGTVPLARIAELLPRLGWQATVHRTRDGVPFLLASPRLR
jgi:hypothetical protein